MVVSPRSRTLEEFLKRPERKPALEYEDGRVTQKVSPKGRHSRLQGKLVSWFERVAEPARLAVALPELRVTYEGASLVPDVAVYRWERLPRDAAGKIADDFYLLVDPAAETVSAFRPDEPARTLAAGDVLSLDDVLPGIALPLAELFAALDVR